MTCIEWPASSRPAGATSGDPLMITSGGHRPGESVPGGDPAEAVLQAAEGTVHLQVMPGITATVRRLLAAYASTLDVLDGLPATPMIATRWHWWSRPSAPIRLPRISWMLRSLTLWHIDRVLSGAEQVFRRRSALGIAGADEADARVAVAEFRASLPSRSRVLRIGRAYDVEHLRGMHPAAQALAAGPGVLFGLPALIVLARAPRYVREAQAATGLERLVLRHIAWLAPIWPVLCVLLQRELNRLWQGTCPRIDQPDEAIDLAAVPVCS